MSEDCGFWYWYYSTYFIAGLSSLSILVTAVLAFYSFCNKYISKQNTYSPVSNSNEGSATKSTINNNDDKNIKLKQECSFIMKCYELSFFFCLILLIITLCLSLLAHKYCHNNILQQAFIGSMLVIIGSLSYHIVIFTLHLAWITSKYSGEDDGDNSICGNIGFIVSSCVIIHWILMSIVAFLLNCMVQIDDDIIERLENDGGDNYERDVVDYIETELKESNDDIFILSLIVVFITIISHFMVWITICNLFGYKFGKLSSSKPTTVSTVEINV